MAEHVRLGRYLTTVLACAIAVGLVGVRAEAQSNVYVEPSASLVNQTVTVAPGQFAAYKLSLTRGASFVAVFKVEGGLDNKVNVWLLDLANFQQYQARQRFMFFQGTSGSDGTIQQVARYAVRVPETNLYYLVVDNQRPQVFPRAVNIYSYAVLPSATEESLKAQRVMEDLYGKLKQLFVFQDFRISLKHCGLENAFSEARTGSITLCTELLQKLAGQGLNQAGTWVFFHELGHTLLNLWGQPLWDNEDAADEFATAFMLLLQQQKAALEAAQSFSSDAPATQRQQALSKLVLDDRHTLSPQRARNIIRWLNQRDALLRRWARVFVPNMQTNMLLSLDRQQDDWIDHALVRSEVAKRNAVSEK
jgi:hypothetical protein